MGRTSCTFQTAVLAAVCFGVAFLAPPSFARTAHHYHKTHRASHHAAAGSGVVSYAGGLVTVYPATGGSTVHRAAHGHTHRVSYVHPSGSYYHSAASSAGNYLAAMGGESRWPDGKLIEVYVAPGKPEYRGIVANCFNQWSAATHGKIRWQMCSNPSDADYCITWTRHQHELNSGTEAGLTTTDTDEDDATGREYIVKARTSVLTRFDGHELGDKDIEQTVLHEVGHGLGLEGHSPNSCDIMYYAVSPKQSCYLSQRDKNTMDKLYCD